MELPVLVVEPELISKVADTAAKYDLASAEQLYAGDVIGGVHILGYSRGVYDDGVWPVDLVAVTEFHGIVGDGKAGRSPAQLAGVDGAAARLRRN